MTSRLIRSGLSDQPSNPVIADDESRKSRYHFRILSSSNQQVATFGDSEGIYPSAEMQSMRFTVSNEKVVFHKGSY